MNSRKNWLVLQILYIHTFLSLHCLYICTPPHLTDFIVWDAPIKVSATVCTEGIYVHLNKEAVRFGDSNTLQVCSFLHVNRLVLWEARPHVERFCRWASQWPPRFMAGGDILLFVFLSLWFLSTYWDILLFRVGTHPMVLLFGSGLSCLPSWPLSGRPCPHQCAPPPPSLVMASWWGVFRVLYTAVGAEHSLSGPLQGGEQLFLVDYTLRLSPASLNKTSLLPPVCPMVVYFPLRDMGRNSFNALPFGGPYGSWEDPSSSSRKSVSTHLLRPRTSANMSHAPASLEGRVGCSTLSYCAWDRAVDLTRSSLIWARAEHFRPQYDSPLVMLVITTSSSIPERGEGVCGNTRRPLSGDITSALAGAVAGAKIDPPPLLWRVATHLCPRGSLQKTLEGFPPLGRGCLFVRHFSILPLFNIPPPALWSCHLLPSPGSIA